MVILSSLCKWVGVGVKTISFLIYMWLCSSRGLEYETVGGAGEMKLFVCF